MIRSANANLLIRGSSRPMGRGQISARRCGRPWPDSTRSGTGACLPPRAAFAPGAGDWSLPVLPGLSGPAACLRNMRARHYAQQGKDQKALDMLSPIYGWFSQGFETPDLLQAKTLLGELR